MANKLVFTLIGMIIGGIASGIFVGTSCAKSYKKRIDDLNEENQQLWDRIHKLEDKDIREREQRVKEAECEVDGSLAAQLVLAREEKRKTEEMVKAHGYSSEEDGDDYDMDEEVEFDDPFGEGESVVLKKPEEKREPKFSMMSQEDYEADYEFRDAESLTYYQEDHVLADEFDERLNNAVDIVGEEALKEAQDTEQDFIYVLDEVEDTMYEIEINHEESYYRDIALGGVV